MGAPHRRIQGDLVISIFWSTVRFVHSTKLQMSKIISCKFFSPKSKLWAHLVPPLYEQVTRQHNDDCKRLLRLMGVPVVEVNSVFQFSFVSCHYDESALI